MVFAFEQLGNNMIYLCNIAGCRDNGSKDEIAFQMNSCSNRSASREHIEQQSACLSSEECAFNRVLSFYSGIKD